MKNKRLKIAFDLDETLGVPLIENDTISGFRMRDGCIELLEKLKSKYEIVIWTVSNRRYVEKVLSYGLNGYFSQIFSWDEIQVKWKDVRLINADFLIDDNEDYKIEAEKYEISDKYIIVPAYGSQIDFEFPLLWKHQIEKILLGKN